MCRPPPAADKQQHNTCRTTAGTRLGPSLSLTTGFKRVWIAVRDPAAPLARCRFLTRSFQPGGPPEALSNPDLRSASLSELAKACKVQLSLPELLTPLQQQPGAAHGRRPRPQLSAWAPSARCTARLSPPAHRARARRATSAPTAQRNRIAAPSSGTPQPAGDQAVRSDGDLPVRPSVLQPAGRRRRAARRRRARRKPW